jgi:hypothetical protein
MAGIGAAVLVGLGVIGAMAGGGDGAKPEADAPAQPPMAITARELHAAFDANEVAAKGRFDGQRLAVTGTISGVTLDLMDNPVVQLESASEFQPVQAKFGKDDAAATGALAKGQEITVICEEVAELIGAPILDGCKLG